VRGRYAVDLRGRQLACVVLKSPHSTDSDLPDTPIHPYVGFPEVIPVASCTTRRHSRDDPRDEDVGVGVVECGLKAEM